MIKTTSITEEPYSFGGLTYLYTFTSCSGTTSSGSGGIGSVSGHRRTFSGSIETFNRTAAHLPNECKHRKQLITLGDYSGAYEGAQNLGGNPGWSVYVGAEGFWPHIFNYYISPLVLWDTSVSSTLSPPKVTIDYSAITSGQELAMRNDCVERANQLKADVLLNIVESHQILPSIKSLANCLPEMARNWSKIRSLIRTASGAYLAWKFGVSPILQDLSNIWKAAPNLARDLQKHIDQVPSTYSRKGEYPVTPDTSSWGLTSLNGYVVHEVIPEFEALTPPTLRYVLTVEPVLKYHSDLINRLDNLMSMFGTGPATLAWELVPFSFVVDWFVDVRATLNLLDNALRAPPYKIRSFTRSHKYEIESTANIVQRSPCDGSQKWKQSAGSVVHSHYVRTRVSQGQMPFWNPRFGKNQAGITAALISQKLSATKLRR